MTRHDQVAEFTAMVNARWPALVRAVMLLGGSRADAEDVVQTTLTRCFEKWERVRRAESPDAYVHRMLVNSWIDRGRRRSSGELLLADPDSGRAADVDHAVRLDIERALGTLSAEQRLVVVLRYYLDLSERQAADVLGVPPGTVKSRLARGLAALATVLATEERGERS
ncbi:SigE family RNA polymerase sigma factor [Nocardioides jejuensis]|uniref:SigE family RNA polymerase sigma factor n=1 Tax=Nocardioides jejuensis TaxID=2502782 RepID=A0A4R1CHL9_9ACTN|nr:SigE family RNA polymerase sigma factor [Nocardioides jejuensis]TCJ30923.1 SigE family RNA polymerase sigma factor [Nocardioides jejuensis]